MLIDVDENELHEWAQRMGYVKLSAIAEYAAQNFVTADGAYTNTAPIAEHGLDCSLGEAAGPPIYPPSMVDANDALRQLTALRGTAIANRVLGYFGVTSLSALSEIERIGFITLAEWFMQEDAA